MAQSMLHDTLAWSNYFEGLGIVSGVLIERFSAVVTSLTWVLGWRGPIVADALPLGRASHLDLRPR